MSIEIIKSWRAGYHLGTPNEHRWTVSYLSTSMWMLIEQTPGGQCYIKCRWNMSNRLYDIGLPTRIALALDYQINPEG